MGKKKSSSSLIAPKHPEHSGVVVDPLSSVPGIGKERKEKHLLKSFFYIINVLLLLCLISNQMLVKSTNVTGVPVIKLTSTCHSYYWLG